MSRAAKIILKKDEERRVLAGHPWVYSNEIEGKLREFAPGDAVDVHAHGGTFLGRGYVNPRSLIAVRIVTTGREELHAPLFRRKFEAARAYRDRVMPGAALRREIFADSDGLPGLIVDRFGGTLAVQSGTAGMDIRQKSVVSALEEVYRPDAVVFANRGSGRELEGLAESVEVVRGSVPDILWVEEAGLAFPVDILTGQKTGFFLDQQENRRRLAGFARNETVLDVFSYTGALALHALKGGASSAALLDASGRALRLAGEALDRNGFSGRYELMEGDAFPLLRSLVKEGRRFGVVSTDPPALAKSKKHLPEALRAYQELAVNGLKLTAPGGFYAASSCSFHVDAGAFRETLARAVRRSGRTARIAEWRGAAPDHPVHPAIPETAYLKCVILAVE
ncbi:MAG: class I SAM-dependent rRNA methyltransferase [Deltaproteobacteria bacterium]|nr:class I SAM-dependent rRNA methyltransferase [Deltaproteobacteria bacterium]